MPGGCGIPYSGKFLREKTLANWWKVRFSWRKLLRIARFAAPKNTTPQNFAEKTATKLRNSWKFLPWKFPTIRYLPVSVFWKEILTIPMGKNLNQIEPSIHDNGIFIVKRGSGLRLGVCRNNQEIKLPHIKFTALYPYWLGRVWVSPTLAWLHCKTHVYVCLFACGHIYRKFKLNEWKRSTRTFQNLHTC